MRGDPLQYSQMSEEIQYIDEELRELCAEVRRGIDEITQSKKMSADKRADKFIYLNGRISRAKQVYHSFKVELRELGKDELREFQQKGTEHNNTITKLTQDLNWAKQAGDRDELMDGKKEEEFNPDTASTAAIIQQAKNVQDESASSLGRSKKLVAQSQAIGTETAAQLKQQTEQMKNIYANVEGIESNLKRADKIMRQFIKSMATDKLILCFILLLLVGIIFIIAWKATHKGDDEDKTEDIKKV